MRRVALISDIHGNAAALAVALRRVPVDVDALEGNSPLKTKTAETGTLGSGRARGTSREDVSSPIPGRSGPLPCDSLVGWLGVFGGDGDGVVGDVVVEALEEVADDRLDDGFLVVLAGERLDGLDRVPYGGHDHLRLAFRRAHEHVRVEEPVDRP